jgi:peptidoglycan hydrolase CwlO-like protein
MKKSTSTTTICVTIIICTGAICFSLFKTRNEDITSIDNKISGLVSSLNAINQQDSAIAKSVHSLDQKINNN